MTTQSKLDQPTRAAFRLRLEKLPQPPRKLLAQIAELIYNGRGSARKPDVAYLPELYESCGVEVNEMYPMLQPLVAGGFIELEGEYPYEDLRVLGPELEEIARVCDAENIPLRNVLVDLRFEALP